MKIDVQGLNRYEIFAALLSAGSAAASGICDPLCAMTRYGDSTSRYLRMHVDDDAAESALRQQLRNRLCTNVTIEKRELHCAEFEERFPGLASTIITELRRITAEERETMHRVAGETGLVVASASGGLWAVIEIAPTIAETLAFVELSPVVCIVSLPFAFFGWRRMLAAR